MYLKLKYTIWIILVQKIASYKIPYPTHISNKKYKNTKQFPVIIKVGKPTCLLRPV